MIRRFGDPPKRGKNYKIRAGSYALLPRNGKLLVTVQSAPEKDIQLPGGGIDPGETAVTALHREVFEETGWHISKPRRVGAFRRFVYMPEYDIWAEKICQIYMAHPTIQLGPPLEPDHNALWLDIGHAPEILGNAGDRYFANLLSRSLTHR